VTRSVTGRINPSTQRPPSGGLSSRSATLRDLHQIAARDRHRGDRVRCAHLDTQQTAAPQAAFTGSAGKVKTRVLLNLCAAALDAPDDRACLWCHLRFCRARRYGRIGAADLGRCFLGRLGLGGVATWGSVGACNITFQTKLHVLGAAKSFDSNTPCLRSGLRGLADRLASIGRINYLLEGCCRERESTQPKTQILSQGRR